MVPRVHNIYLGEYSTPYCPFKRHCVIMLYHSCHQQKCHLVSSYEVPIGLHFGISTPINKSFITKPFIWVYQVYTKIYWYVAYCYTTFTQCVQYRCWILFLGVYIMNSWWYVCVGTIKSGRRTLCYLRILFNLMFTKLKSLDRNVESFPE